MLERYAGHLPEPTVARRVHLIPSRASLDCVHNYPTESVPANAATDIKLVRQSNGVHPATSGYHQIGDTLFAWLKGQAKE